MKNQSTFSVIGMNLLALFTLFTAKEPPADTTPVIKPTLCHRATLGTASLKSMESTWIAIPVACKARGFNADPTPHLSESQSADAWDVYEGIEADV